MELKQTTSSETAFPRYADLACWKSVTVGLHPASLATAHPQRESLESATETLMTYWTGGLKCLKQGARETTHCVWQIAGRTGHGSNLHYLREEESTIYRGTDVRWAHQVPETN